MAREYVVTDGDRLLWDIQVTRDALSEDWLMASPERLIYGARVIKVTWVGDGTTELTRGPEQASPGDVLRLYFALEAGAKATPRRPKD